MSTYDARRPARSADRRTAAHRTALSGEQAGHEIQWRRGVLEQIRSYLTNTEPVGVPATRELAGIFYGYCLGETLQVVAWAPFPRELGSTDHFYLSAKEERQWAKLKNSPPVERYPGVKAVGWFRARTRGQAEASAYDAEFHQRHFPEQHQFALVVRPMHQQPAPGTLYRAQGVGVDATFLPVGRLTLAPGPHVPAPESLIPVRKVAVQEKVRRLAAYGLCALLLMFAAVFALQWNQFRRQGAIAQPLGLQVREEQSGFTVAWNPACSRCEGIRSARLQAGGTAVLLSEAEFKSGHHWLPLKVRVGEEMTFILDAGRCKEISQFISRLP